MRPTGPAARDNAGGREPVAAPVGVNTAAVGAGGVGVPPAEPA
ncbi:hypothetical protein [Micromonospora sp. WMMD712]|nr:hypothetical protein [Micromonospora sp. WMMD712]WFE59717.1 hypothetical protein O7633_23950 [Micromonospora sp. WMMD712]